MNIRRYEWQKFGIFCLWLAGILLGFVDGTLWRIVLWLASTALLRVLDRSLDPRVEWRRTHPKG